MIAVQNLELRAGARLLMEDVTFRIDKGDKIGLVGRNGAGKTTMTKVLAGLTLPADGTVTRSGEIGYLPQDPKVDDMSQLARDRILSARGLDGVARKMRQAQEDMASEDEAVRAKGLRRYDRLEAEFIAGGGYAAESEAAVITSNLDLPERVLSQPLSTLSGGQRRLERGHHVAGRADQPPGCRLDHVAAGLPQELLGRPAGHQPRRGPHGARRQPRLLP